MSSYFQRRSKSISSVFTTEYQRLRKLIGLLCLKQTPLPITLNYNKSSSSSTHCYIRIIYIN